MAGCVNNRPFVSESGTLSQDYGSADPDPVPKEIKG